ncbi:flagellar biosynthesis protein FlhF [Xylophilus rhododendri]|uniref:Flagellar biosynthesis protein FlhF n=1 Tax=Xylophilus rhododendri TaxID=2697032 RepID=A0A857J2J7_9BURK|nr:flagellar biosynthesis protein FlhF [Xylophilus rhododendri]QHI97976.1 flagellar biosynthesis protein FlhF [Xylophilus rhododendri]
MNIRRFTAATAREALAKARHAFGDGTLILSNRPVPNGVEVVATAEESLSDLQDGAQAEPAVPARIAARPAAAAPAKPSKPAGSPLQARAAAQMDRPALGAARPAAAAARPAASTVQEDTEQLAMSTLSFQEYVRERMLRRRHEALNGQAQGLAGDEALPAAPLAMPIAERVERMERSVAPALSGNPRPAAAAAPAAAPRVQHAFPAVAAAAAAAAPQRRAAPAPAAGKGVVDELQSMRELIEDRFNTLAWLGQAKQDPIQSNLMLKLIRGGYSPALARAVLERLPQEANAGEAVRWLIDVLQRNLRTAPGNLPLAEEGGVFALVGSTGVGKTTTAAKLAAQCARQYGPQSVGLITLDTYRVAAHEQLRAYGRMLGVVAHLAHDRAALQDLLGLLANKKMVLIDTTGVAPRDPRKRDMLDVLDLPGVQRLLVLNAGNHGDTMDEVVTSFKSTGAQQAILSKTDEAVKMGPAVDALIRHQLVLRGVTNGQRVPEDWEEADAGRLVRASMRSPAKSAFDPKAADLSFFFSSDVSGAQAAFGQGKGSLLDA